MRDLTAVLPVFYQTFGTLEIGNALDRVPTSAPDEPAPAYLQITLQSRATQVLLRYRSCQMKYFFLRVFVQSQDLPVPSDHMLATQFLPILHY